MAADRIVIAVARFVAGAGPSRRCGVPVMGAGVGKGGLSARSSALAPVVGLSGRASDAQRHFLPWRASMHAGSLFVLAISKGVPPTVFSAFGSAPAAIRTFITSMWHPRAAL